MRRQEITQECLLLPVLEPGLSDTPWSKDAGVLPSLRRLATRHDGESSRGLLSRSVSRVAVPACFRMPHGTSERFFENIERRILISVHDEA